MPAYTREDIVSTINDVLSWKKQTEGISEDEPLLSSSLLEYAGTSSGDWYAFALGRLGISDGYEEYLAALDAGVTARYATPDKLDADKATEWHRIGLTVLGAGGDPTAFGTGPDGQPIDLVADGAYNRGATVSLDRQGLNGPVFALILMDSMRYEIPEGAYDTRDSIITQILQAQTDEGGFSLSGNTPSLDITAMALQALAPYYNSEQQYTYTPHRGEEVTGTVRQAVDKALDFLSSCQQKDGNFGEDQFSAETTAQIIIALCSLGVDPINDSRFVKNGACALDGLMQFRNRDGGFSHTLSTDGDDASAQMGSNSMAGEQALCALTAVLRYYGGFRSLYDLRPEMDQTLKEQIASLNESIRAIESDEESPAEVVQGLFDAYLDIPVEERSYVYAYPILADAMEQAGIENTSEPLCAYMNVTQSGNGAVVNVLDAEITLPERIAYASGPDMATIVIFVCAAAAVVAAVVLILRHHKKKKAAERSL